jgi:dTDP-4-amino-4,6-dideoxygalactose transaminase
MENADYINGTEVNTFARNLQNYLNTESVIPCANGTDALQLALMSLNLNPDDEVITSAFSFVAPAEAIMLLGLKPVFADVDESTFNIDCEKIEQLITPKTKVLLPVHLFGQGADMEAIMKIAKKHNLYVIEDVAQSLGSEFIIDGNAKKLGTIGTIGCTSFFPTKNLGCFGDGGACYTNDNALAQRITMLAKHGSTIKYKHEEVGINSRLDTIQSAVLLVKLQYIDNFISARINIANQYNKAFESLPGIDIPKTQKGSLHTYNQYTIRVKNGKRDLLKEFLKEKNIPSQIYYPFPLHNQNVFLKKSKIKYNCPVSEKLCEEVLSLPISTELTDEQIKYIIDSVITFINNNQ